MSGGAVMWGSILAVAGSIVVIVFLAFRISKLIKQDAERHAKQE